MMLLSLRHLIFMVLVLCLVGPASSSWWWGRRCNRVDCRWGNWSPWTVCNHPCGHSGSQTRSRSIAQHPSCGGSGCHGPSQQTQGCNRFCRNGGTQQYAHCTCPDEFWGTCCEHPCTRIENCRHRVCTNGTNHQCRTCMYSYTPEIRAYRKKNADGYIHRICERVCSWRPNSCFCYPGTCSPRGVPDSCRCAPGFQAPNNNCMNIVNNPNITHCQGQLKTKTGGTVTEFKDVDCNHQSLTMYTNLNANHLELDWQTNFIGPNMTEFPLPYYVHDFAVGVVQAGVSWSINKGVRNNTSNLPNGTSCYLNDTSCYLNDTSDELKETSGYLNCIGNFSETNPNRNLHHCQKEIDFEQPWSHGDRLTVIPQVRNGGFVRLKNYDRGIEYVPGPNRFYGGRTFNHTAIVVFDFRSPVHCSVNIPCEQKFLDLGNPYTKQNTVKAVYEGWSDLPSGVKKFELEVFKMKPYGDVLGNEQGPLVKIDTPPENTNCSVNLTEPGMYCFVLAVDDNAGNHRYSRSFLLFDNVNSVQVSSHGNTAIRVTSAAANTSYTWITDLSQQVRVDWKGHFMNQFHNEHKLLAAIRPHSPAVDEGYEVRKGQPPGVRSMEAIPNVNGVTSYHVQPLVDKNGGVNTTEPTGNWTAIPNFQSEALSMSIPRSDGDSLRLHVKAKDVIGNEAIDSVLVHIDSSPPEVTIIGLSKNGHRGLAVHKSTDLFDMKLEVEAYDDHSGLFTIAWSLHDLADSTRVHGSGHLAVVRTNPGGTCEPPSCACVPATQMCYQRNYTVELDPSKMSIPEGSHDHDYMYTVNVTNNAKLITVTTFKVTVDTSPPHTGVVKDGLPDSPDVDFQSHMTQHASWEGFFDKESGVMLYKYGFADGCLKADDFAPTSQKVNSTQNTWVSRSLLRPGKYHVTVVAYNHASDPSSPVCSDGVVVDVTPPRLSDLSVEGLFVHEAVVTDNTTQETYYLSGDRKLILLNNPSSECRNGSEVNIDSYVIQRYDNGTRKTRSLSPELCSQLAGAVRTEYLESEHKLRFAWFGEDDETGISDYETGLSTSVRGEPDLQPFQSTHNHRHYHTYHSGLSHGQEFYIHIKAINKAGLSHRLVIGPVVVEAWASSDIVRNLKMGYRRVDGGSHVIISWKQTTDQSLIQTVRTASVTIVDMKSRMSLLKPKQVEDEIRNAGSETEISVFIPETSFTRHLHPQHAYQVVMRTLTVAGHYHDYLSQVYTHDHGPPIPGLVWHAQPEGQSVEHIDIQTSQDTVRVCWSGFHHPWYNVSYKAELQLMTGEPVVTSPILDHTSLSYTFNQLSLQAFQEFRTVVTGITPEGNSSSSSNELSVLPENLEAVGVTGFDGQGCTQTNSTDQSTDHHFSLHFACEDDMTFQLSQTTYSVYWNIPESINYFIKEVLWQVQLWSPERRTWESSGRERSVGKVTSATRTDMQFSDGSHYRSALHMCHENGCFQAVYTSGFHVLTTPPSPGRLYVDSTNETSLSVTGIRFTWTPYHQIRLSSSVQGISYYEWTVMVDYQGVQPRSQLFRWSRVTVPEAEASNYTVNHTLPYPLSPAYCYVLVLKGYNHVGLSASKEAQIIDCKLVNLRQNIVIDAVGARGSKPGHVRPIRLERNANWPHPDQEFTPSTTTLQAVWPSLRHQHFLWKAVSGSTLHQGSNVRPIIYQDFHCSDPATLACGEAEDNFININHLKLNDGLRYYICIYANETVIQRENSEERLPTVSACSDGIVLDAESPIAGRVIVGSLEKHNTYQTEQNAMLVRWEGFADKDVRSSTFVHTGIADYKIAIGTFVGGEDLLHFTSVGTVNFKVVTELQLQQGRSYFVTVKAKDFVGRDTSVTSEIVTIDATAPQPTGDHVTMGGTYHSSANSLHANWQGLFLDPESGIAVYRWCIGSRPNHCDVTNFRETVHTEVMTDNTLQLIPGRKHFVTVQAQNAAGLVSAANSRGFIIDLTPPSPGHVLDGATSSSGEDQDGQTDLRHLAAAWGGFHDSETGIWHYLVSVGSSPTFTNIMEETNWELTSSLRLEGLTLEPGIKYHTRVRACNWAGLCTVVTSDGIIPDNSPPVLGEVLDGPSGEDAQYQASRSRICAVLGNMHDVHSGIPGVTWWAGTSLGADDILPKTSLHVTERACFNIQNQMPLSTLIFTTAEVKNGVGLTTQATSDGFMVDITSPEIRTDVHFNPKAGSLRSGSQVVRTAVHMMWELYDGESGLREHYVSLMPVGYTHLHFPTLKLHGDVRETIYPNVTLRDGERYQARVVGCNGAGICTTTVSQPILVDHSRPKPGAFAAVSDHSLDLGRHRPGYMLYNTNIVSLAFLGFSDPHTGVIKYYITVGTFYDSSDLVGGEPLELNHTDDDHHRDEGSVQKVNLTLVRDVQTGDEIYVTVWALNSVGLESRRLHGTFRAVASSSTTGILELVRRCSSQSCEGHCTCAPQDQRCAERGNCTDIKGRRGYQQVNVQDIYPGETDINVTGEFTYAQCTLAARWYATGTGVSPRKYEWSVSLKGQLPGSGVIDRAREPIWFDAGSGKEATFTLRRPRGTFLPGAVYIFHVRAWYTESAVAVYTSRGVLVDGTPPDLSRSKVPMEVDTLDSSTDVDITTNQTAVNVTWRGVFRDAQTNLTHFVVLIGTKPGLSDVISREFPCHVTAATISGIRLVEAVWYFTTVVAENQAGLQTIAHSDGFEVDLSPPSGASAVVKDGARFHNQKYQNDKRILSSRWHGFYDLQSGIHHYYVCVSKKGSPEESQDCRDVGNALTAEFRINNQLETGETYVTNVLAVDAAGHVSPSVQSDGITIDTSPPEPADAWSSGPNLVQDSSFDKDETSSPWTLRGGARRTAEAAKKGSWSILVDGSAEQDIRSNNTATTKLTFSTILPPVNQSQGHVTHQQASVGAVTLGNRHFSFVTSTSAAWQRHVQYLPLHYDAMLIFSSAAPNHKFLLDDVTLEPITHVLGERELSDGISVEVVPLSGEREGYVVASWQMTDPESNIVDYKWAVGTVRGGVQIQTFFSTKTTSHGRTKPALLSHGVEVHVTVVATNGAGAASVVHSQPVLADFTPPEICCLTINGVSASTTVYVPTGMTSLMWTAHDPESDVTHCDWAIGSSANTVDLIQYTRSVNNSAIIDTSTQRHGNTVYVTIRCTNTKDMTSYLGSSAIVIVTGPPDAKNAAVFVIPSSLTQYPVRGQHLPTTDHLTVGWTGFVDPSGISHFQVKLVREESVVLDWTTSATSADQFIRLDGIHLRPFEVYRLYLRAVNHAGLISEPVQTSFTVENTSPSQTGKHLVSWWENEHTLHMNWTEVFLARSNLLYEVNIGTRNGGNDVLRWIETKRCSMTVKDVDHSREHYVTITAINRAGLYHSRVFKISYQ